MCGGLLVLTIDLPPELICSLYGHLRPKAVGYQGLHRTTVRFCSPHARELSPFRTEGMILARLFRNDCRLISQVCVVPRCVTLCGKGDYCLLSVFSQIPGSPQRISIQWIARKSRGGTTDIHTTSHETAKAADQLQNWSAQVLSLEYKNTWFSEDSRRHTLSPTKCSKGVSNSQLFLLFETIPVLAKYQSVRRILLRSLLACGLSNQCWYFFTVMKQMFKYDTFIMHHADPRMCYIDDAPFEAQSLICTIGTEGFWELNIHLRKHGDDYVILIQLMPHCSLWDVAGSQGYLCWSIIICCVSVSGCDGSNSSSQGYSPLATHYMNTGDLQHLI